MSEAILIPGVVTYVDGMVLHASPGACRHSNNHACSCCDFDGYYADKYREQCPWWVADDE